MLALPLILSACAWLSPVPDEAPSAPPEGSVRAEVPAVEPPAGALDVVVITLDTTRADHLGAYGYFRPTSPTFDGMARRGLLFERLVVPMATTLPTHTSLFTGTWPHEHGILANVQHGGRKFVPSEGLRSFATHLAGQGYQTAAFVSAAPLNRTSGIERGFEHFDDPEQIERRAGATTDRAVTWLEQVATDDPMLLWVHYYDPHNPFVPPRTFLEQIKALDDRDQLDAWMDARRIDPVARRPSGQVVRARSAHDRYDAEIRYMDSQLGLLLAALDARGRTDRTLYVIAGDHGEGLNQHGEPGHGLVWDEQLHAPLVLVGPGIDPGRVPHTLSAADILPTALGLVDLPGEDAFVEQASGTDVLATDFAVRPVMSQTSARQEMFGKPMTYTLTDDRWKCRWSEEEDAQVWDLDADPFELAPIEAPDRAQACVDGIDALLTLQISRAQALGSGKTVEMPAAELEALRQLGYME